MSNKIWQGRYELKKNQNIEKRKKANRTIGTFCTFFSLKIQKNKISIISKKYNYLIFSPEHLLIYLAIFFIFYIINKNSFKIL